ncbi:MAG: tRNA (adenosine(37)-N6)-dimethylallyltransferase MiaA [Phycisphaerae bacterium]|jgi:tRNA dimethylallyltransferase
MSIRVHLLIGCTAAGKGQVALELARRMNAEIVSVDSMKIYRRMDIGTNKPSLEVRREVPHHLIDVVEPSESYSLGRFVADADRAIREIAARGRPILAVGGTMMYVRGLAWGVFEGPGHDATFRAELRRRAAAEGVPALHAELAGVDPVSAGRIHPNDFKRIERALEVYHLTGRPISAMQTQWESPPARYDCRIAALVRPREAANRAINARVRRMIDAGLVDEVKRLLAEPKGLSPQAAQAVGYAEIIAHLKGRYTLAEAVERIKINTRRLGKHQRTWMRRMTGIARVEVADDDAPAAVADRVERAWATMQSV